MILSFFERQFNSLSYTSTTLEASSHWCDGLLLWWRSFGFTWKESKIHHTRSNVLFVFLFAEDQVSSRLCMCICLCLSSVSMYRNYHDTQQWDALIFKRSLANSSRTHTLSLSLSLIRSRSHSLASLQRWYYVHFVSCFKNQSFISWESFFSFFVWAMQFVKFNLSFDCFKMFNQLILVFPSRFFFFI